MRPFVLLRAVLSLSSLHYFCCLRVKSKGGGLFLSENYFFLLSLSSGLGWFVIALKGHLEIFEQDF